MAMKLKPAQHTQTHQVADVEVGARRVEALVNRETLALRNILEELIANDGVFEHPSIE